MIDTYRVPGSACVNCGKGMDAASPVGGGREPQAGDCAVCFYCRHLMVYGNDLRLRNLTDEEVIEVAGDPELVFAMKILESADQQNEGHNAAQTPPGNRAHRRAHRPR
jgi:hypothetical protein